MKCGPSQIETGLRGRGPWQPVLVKTTNNQLSNDREAQELFRAAAAWRGTCIDERNSDQHRGESHENETIFRTRTTFRAGMQRVRSGGPPADQEQAGRPIANHGSPL